MQVLTTVDRKYGPMRIVERYPLYVKMFKGSGIWAVFTPARFCLSMVHRLWLKLKKEGEVKPVVGNTSERGNGFKGKAREVGTGSGAAAAGRRARIISIGNLEVGGGGKTPCAMSLAENVMGRGGEAVVVTRGYKSLVLSLKKCPFVVTAGHNIEYVKGLECNIDSEFFKTSVGRKYSGDQRNLTRLIGDEVALYSGRGIPAVVDPDRARGIDVAVRLFEPTHILLDDAFQHRSVYRDIDILLLDAVSPFGTGRLLPFGTLRERPDAARRAHVLIFTRAPGGKIPDEALPYTEDKPVFFATHKPVNLIGRDYAAHPFSHLEGRSVVLISGVARPHAFEELVGKIGIHPEISFRFVDHHGYGPKDVEWMLGASPEGAVFLTTEKDWGKLAGLLPQDIEAFAIRISMDIEGIEKLMDIVTRA